MRRAAQSISPWRTAYNTSSAVLATGCDTADGADQFSWRRVLGDLAVGAGPHRDQRVLLFAVHRVREQAAV